MIEKFVSERLFVWITSIPSADVSEDLVIQASNVFSLENRIVSALVPHFRPYSCFLGLIPLLFGLRADPLRSYSF